MNAHPPNLPSSPGPETPTLKRRLRAGLGVGIVLAALFVAFAVQQDGSPLSPVKVLVLSVVGVGLGLGAAYLRYRPRNPRR
jgi:phosphate/sulfate permease